jgi:ribosomal protein S1
MEKENEQKSEEWTRVFESMSAGQLIDAVVTQASERGIDVKIGGQVEAFVPAYHLSDHRSHFVPMAKRFKVGETIKDLLVLRVRPQKKYIVS